MSETGERIKAHRVASGWSQQRLVEQAGLDVQTIGRIELGQSIGHEYTLRKIAEALGIPAVELMEAGEDE